jgi:hypothetical protein
MCSGSDRRPVNVKVNTYSFRLGEGAADFCFQVRREHRNCRFLDCRNGVKKFLGNRLRWSIPVGSWIRSGIKSVLLWKCDPIEYLRGTPWLSVPVKGSVLSGSNVPTRLLNLPNSTTWKWRIAILHLVHTVSCTHSTHRYCVYKIPPDNGLRGLGLRGWGV